MADHRWLILLGIVVAALLPFMGIPRLVYALNTVSTNDARVNGYVTIWFPMPALAKTTSTRPLSSAIFA